MSLSCIDRTIDYTAFAGKSWQKKMDICNECNCCEQHNCLKPRYVLPIVHEYDAIDVLDTTKEVWRLGLCRCKCRFLARRMCEEDNYEIMTASPCPSELPMPRKDWLKKERDDDLRLLDEATHEALEHYWKGQVKACQYAIFHIC
jgi:hypothetical protein